MGRTVTLDSITVDRVLHDGDDIQALAGSIKKVGLKVPILVGPDYELIDGLRRLEALRSLGETEVEVVATSMYPVACDTIDKARVHGVEALPLTGERIWELTTALQPLLQITKSHYARGRPKVQGSRTSAGGRPLLAKALGLRSEAYLQAVTQVHRALSDPEKGAKAAEALELIDEGKLTYYGAIDFMKKVTGLPGRIIKMSEQQALLGSATASLHGTIKALNQLGPLDKKFPRDEVEGRLSELTLIRTRLGKFIKLLNEEINGE